MLLLFQNWYKNTEQECFQRRIVLYPEKRIDNFFRTVSKLLYYTFSVDPQCIKSEVIIFPPSVPTKILGNLFLISHIFELKQKSNLFGSMFWPNASSTWECCCVGRDNALSHCYLILNCECFCYFLTFFKGILRHQATYKPPLISSKCYGLQLRIPRPVSYVSLRDSQILWPT